MIWMTWRQHRAEALSIGLVVALMLGVMILLGLPMRHAFYSDGVAGCVFTDTPSCLAATSRFEEAFMPPFDLLTTWLLVPPVLLGMFVGAPLLAREFEHGTWQLAWTQAVPRPRWVWVKLLLIATVVVACATVLSATYAWLSGPVQEINGLLDTPAFEFGIAVFAASTLYAVSAGVFAGAMIRRTVPAMAAAIAAYLVVRLPVAVWARPRFLPPARAANDPLDHNAPGTSVGDWVLDVGYSDAGGRPLSAAAEAAFQRVRESNQDVNAFAHEQGLLRWVEYHPAGTYWHFQLVEAAVYLTLAAVLIAVVVWRIRKRAV